MKINEIIDFSRNQKFSIQKNHRTDILYFVLLSRESQFPKTLKTLKRLKGISFFVCIMTALPRSIYELKNLEFITLTESVLLKFDSNFLQFKKLKFLELRISVYKRNKRFIPKHLRYKKEFTYLGERYIKLAKHKKDLEDEE